MRMRAFGLIALAFCGASAVASAVDGFVINTRANGSSSELQYYGVIDGELWRHEIKNDQVVSSNKIYGGPATRPAVNPGGTFVAFVKKTGSSTGKVAMINATGGGEVLLADCLRNSYLDFPHDDWIYFTMGSYHESSSGLLKRVNVKTRKLETVWQLRTTSGAKARIAQIQISNDLKRAAIRMGDSGAGDTGTIIAYDMAKGDGSLQSAYYRIVGARYSCAGGLFAGGVYVLDGNGSHTGFDIRRWTDGSKVYSFANSTAFSWPPNKGTAATGDDGHSIFHSGGAANSDRWMTIVTGGARNYKKQATVLINWMDKRCIVVTAGLGGEWDHGDFWEGSLGQPPEDQDPVLLFSQPSSGQTLSATLTVAVTANDPDAGTGNGAGIASVAFELRSGTTVAASGTDTAAPYSWSLDTTGHADGSYTLHAIATSTAGAGGTTVTLDIPVTIDNSRPNATPVVNAGGDQNAFIDIDLVLNGSVQDDGLPAGKALTVSWTVISGNAASVQINSSNQAVTSVRFSASGSFELRLTANDGELQALDAIIVTVSPRPTLDLLSPVGGEVWAVGSTQAIRWQAQGIEDLAIKLSLDGGQTWQTIEPAINMSSPNWGNYPWEIPNTPSSQAIVQLEGYFAGETEPARSPAPFTLSAAPDTTPPMVTLTVLGVTATVDDPTVSAIKLNGTDMSPQAGEFFGSAILSTSPGASQVVLTALDAAGNTAMRLLAVQP